ncbi:ribosome rescue protein RqcH [Candidatus Nanohalovita haloferacivicina]|uniref:ribosome rescue protein RqcH n=1 Tax=Candidatus Nanohalovita haloferacivicina TaxID=2978046 RepID=UPI00325FD175|nr:Fibronectin-binding domain-containing protein [Candidatus Nanohalobia archaeon BNXNv]
MELTSLDLSILMEELNNLEEGFVQKVYQRGQELTIEVYVPGEDKKRLVIGTDRCFISKYKRENPERPPGFCMELRKHLGRVDSIKQRGFDRILEIESGDKKFIAEMFGKGNFILLKEGKIIGALREQEWADRSIRVGEEYVYPEPTADPREVDDYFSLMDEEEEIVREIAAKLSFGGTYAEEICQRAEIEKDTEVGDLEEEEKEELRQQIDRIIGQEDLKPVLYTEDLPERAAPFPLEKYEDLDREDMETFSEALDEYYYRRTRQEKEKEKKEAFQEKLQGLEAQKEQQERKLQGLQKSSKQNREKAEIIYENYQLLQKIKESLEQSIEENGWKETEEKLKEAETELSEHVNSLNEREEFFSASVDGYSIKLRPGQNLEATASSYYDKAKDSESKMESVEKALEKTQEKIDDLSEDEFDYEEEMEDKSQKRSKKWFEKYRWFRSSEDYLVIAGRDAQTNEMLVKKHMEDNDLYFHADFDGAPSVVVKDGQDCGEATREEAAKAAVTFSKTWKAGIGADDVYYVDPEQVTENPESGEYLGKGAFVIRGDREYMRNMSVEASVGAYQIEDTWVPMCGPETAISEHCEEYINLEPGHTKKSEIAKKIQSGLGKDKELDLDYIIRSLPPGQSDIKN